MSDLTHVVDKGRMIDAKISGKFLKCGKCGFMVLKSKIYDKYDDGTLELPVK